MSLLPGATVGLDSSSSSKAGAVLLFVIWSKCIPSVSIWRARYRTR